MMQLKAKNHRSFVFSALKYARYTLLVTIRYEINASKYAIRYTFPVLECNGHSRMKIKYEKKN